jgi:hypothetical protein
MANKKIDKFQAYCKYMNNEIKIQTINEESKQRFMEVVLNYGHPLDSYAYEYFELEKSESDRTSNENLGLKLWQEIQCDDDYKSSSTKDDINRFRGILAYCMENADPLLHPNADSDFCYNKIQTYLFNDFLKKQ